MPKSLVIVESPTKAKILKKILGKEYIVESSAGHIRDLPEKKEHLSEAQKKHSWARLGIDVENDFKALYCSSPTKKKKIKKLKDFLKKDVDKLILATDEDREGEAIAWHLNEILNPKGTLEAKRVVFHEITKDAIIKAFENPRDLYMDMVDAQQARRILDRLVGFTLSPLLWKKIRFGLSAGRVQSVAVRILMDREYLIRAFNPEEYWTVTASLKKDNIDFESNLAKKDGDKFVPVNEEEAADAENCVKNGKLTVTKIKKRVVNRNPSPPFITSTIQQDASRKLGFSVKKTMQLAQKLYEGIDLKEEGATGLITYMRTDSITLSETALTQTKEMLGTLYGPEYQLDEPRVFKTKAKGAQEAHEAIRPTDVTRKPEALKDLLEPDMFKLYDLIWKRTLATQAPRAVFDAVSADLTCDKYIFRSSGQTLKFPGFMRIYVEGADNPEELLDGKDKILPELVENEEFNAEKVEKVQHFTKPPARYTEAALVKKMEEEGIGRPSTYAPTISTIIARGYANMENKALFPTDTADVVNGLLVKHFPDIVDLQFTAGLEDTLDLIAEGKKKYVPFLHEFFDPFAKLIAEKDKSINKDDVVNEPTDEICEECSKPMVIKLGRMGKFMSCSDYPNCKFAKQIGEMPPEQQELIDKYAGLKCTACESDMVVKASRYGFFLACSGYPKCKQALPIVKSTGVNCPVCSKEELVEKRGKVRRRLFWGCNGYPDCDYISRFKPVRNGDKDIKGFYVEKKGEEEFFEFIMEEYEEQKAKYQEKLDRAEEVKAKKKAAAEAEEVEA